MKKKLLLYASFCLSACAPGVAPWKPVAPSANAFDLPGFRFQLADAEGWHVNTRTPPDRVLLVKNNNPKDPYENFAIEAYTTQAPLFKSDEEFLNAVKQGKAIHGDARYAIVREDIRLYKHLDGNCVLSNTLAEDGGNPPSFGFGDHRRPGKMMFEQATLTCREPGRPANILDLSYSLRYYPGEGDEHFTDKAMQVIASVAKR